MIGWFDGGRSERRHVARRLRRRRCAARRAVGVDRDTRPRRHAVFRAGPASGPRRHRIHVEVPDSTVVRISPTSSSFRSARRRGAHHRHGGFRAPRRGRSSGARHLDRRGPFHEVEHSTRSPTSSVLRASCTSGLTGSTVRPGASARVRPGCPRTHPDPGARRARGAHWGGPDAGGPRSFESTTPTGAAVLATIVDTWCPMPPMTVTAVGRGWRTRQRSGRQRLAARPW